MKRLIAIFATALFCVSIASAENETNKPAAAVDSGVKPEDFKQPGTLAELLALPSDQLNKVDIARIDLLCAEGLPTSEKLDIEKCIKTLDEWTRKVKAETERNHHRFVEHPEKFKNSIGRYRMAAMAAVISQDLRVKYNPEREKELLDNKFFAQGEPYGEAERSFTSDSSDLFLHGLLSDKRYGTCASMPYLYVAIGRRLGYPVSIAGTHMHSYVYYDEGNGKHFNFEATENRGFVTPSDDEYRKPLWGAPSDPEFFEKRGLLRPMSNKESMARILAGRAAVFRSHGRHDEEAQTWATAARYFPDTPVWKGIAENMQQCAKLDEYHQWRDGVWKKLAALPVPRGPGFAYFHDKRIKLHLFMNESFDRNAIEKVADEFKKEMAEYAKAKAKQMDLAASDQPAPIQFPSHFWYRPPDGNEVKVPADFMPPFPNGEIPPDLGQRIMSEKPQDADTLLGIVWQYYAQTQAMKVAKQKAELARIASDNPILISEESIPPEFRQGVPMELRIRLSGLHSAQEIVVELWRYKHELELRQRETLADPMVAALRQAGVPDSVARMAGVPNVPGMQGADYRSRGTAGIPGQHAMDYLPAMQQLAAQGMIPGRDGRTLSAKEVWDRRTKEQNEQVMEKFMQHTKSQNTIMPGMSLPYQAVPASAAANNPAVENPMPFGGGRNSPNSPLTPLP